MDLNSTRKCNFDWLVKERAACSIFASLLIKTKEQLWVPANSSLKEHDIRFTP